MTTLDEMLDHLPMEYGKHAGKTPSEIAEIDPGYICWLYDEIHPKRCSRALVVDCRDEVATRNREWRNSVEE